MNQPGAHMEKNADSAADEEQGPLKLIGCVWVAPSIWQTQLTLLEPEQVSK